MRLVRDLTWALRGMQKLARGMRKLEGGEFTPGWGYLIFSKGMMTYTTSLTCVYTLWVWGKGGKGSISEWGGTVLKHTALRLSTLARGVLAFSQRHGTARARQVRLSSHLDAWSRKHPRPNIKLNYVPWNWKSFLPFPSNRCPECCSPWFIFPQAVYPHGLYIHLRTTHWKSSWYNKAVWWPELPASSQHAYSEYTTNLTGTWYVISWNHSSAISLITLQGRDGIFCRQPGVVSSGFTLYSLAHGGCSTAAWGWEEGTTLVWGLVGWGGPRVGNLIHSIHYTFTEDLWYAKCCAMCWEWKGQWKTLLCRTVPGAYSKVWVWELDEKLYKEIMVMQGGKCGKEPKPLVHDQNAEKRWWANRAGCRGCQRTFPKWNNRSELNLEGKALQVKEQREGKGHLRKKEYEQRTKSMKQWDIQGKLPTAHLTTIMAGNSLKLWASITLWYCKGLMT